jgi:hypothetical protein
MAEMEFWIPPIRMEEEEETEPARAGFVSYRSLKGEGDEERYGKLESLLGEVLMERRTILADTKLQTRAKLKLLEANHRTLLVMRGGRVKTFRTEAVVFAILGFSAVLLIALAVLNVKAGLPIEITLTFLGTTLGGVIATIAQKLGRI